MNCLSRIDTSRPVAALLKNPHATLQLQQQQHNCALVLGCIGAPQTICANAEILILEVNKEGPNFYRSRPKTQGINADSVNKEFCHSNDTQIGGLKFDMSYKNIAHGESYYSCGHDTQAATSGGRSSLPVLTLSKRVLAGDTGLMTGIADWRSGTSSRQDG